MVFNHVANRKVFLTQATFKPDATWMKWETAEFLRLTEVERLRCASLMRDLDGMFSSDFDRVYPKQSIGVKPVGPQAPILNALVERWIQSLNHEALNHFIVFGLHHFDHIVSEHLSYYQESRPHQSFGNRLISTEKDEDKPAVVSLDQVRYETRLSGLLKHHYRAA